MYDSHDALYVAFAVIRMFAVTLKPLPHSDALPRSCPGGIASVAWQVTLKCMGVNREAMSRHDRDKSVVKKVPVAVTVAVTVALHPRTYMRVLGCNAGNAGTSRLTYRHVVGLLVFQTFQG